LSGAGEYPYTSEGIGSPEARSKAIVATSLATAKYLGTITGCTGYAPPFNRKPQRIYIVMRKERTVKPTLGEFFQVDDIIRTPIDGPRREST
jgi:hypothetical protein